VRDGAALLRELLIGVPAGDDAAHARTPREARVASPAGA
jgi:hypothetical protein